jgi:methionyl aminopeptidase
MISIKNKRAISKMEQAGRLLASIFEKLPNCIDEGVTTAFIDGWIAKELVHNNLESKMRGYHGYPHVSCISLNDEVVHGIPSSQKILKKGDFVKVDVCASWQGYCADMARIFAVGDVRQELISLQHVAIQSLNKGIEQMQPGNRLADVSAAIGGEIERHGYGIVRDFAGHGIGKEMHEDPEILNYGVAGSGPLLRVGMAFAIEPMLTLGKHDVYVTQDGWTVKTVDGSVAAHVEDTVIVTENGPKILTRTQN